MKGLYKKARSGEIRNYTGFDSAYDIPINPELSAATGSDAVDLCVESVFNYLVSKGLIAS